MNFWRTLVAAVVAAGLASYIYWVEQPRIEAEQASGRILVFAPERVDRIELHYPDSGNLIVQRKDEAWRLAEPMDAPADANTVHLLLAAILDARVERSIEKSEAEELSSYGLEGDGERVRISLRLDDGTLLPDIIVGRTTPVGYQAFVRVVGRNELLVTPLLFHSGVKKTDFDFRSKVIFQVDPNTVNAVTLESDGITYRLERSRAGWEITTPIIARADVETVSSLLGALNAVTPLAFYEGEDIDPARFGLVPPVARFEVELGDGRREGLSIGAASDDATPGYYVERLSDGQLLKGPEWLAARFRVDVSALRDKHLFTCEFADISRVTVEDTHDSTFVLERTSDGSWFSPTRPERRLNQRRAERSARGIVELAGESSAEPRSLAAYGLDAPDIKVAIEGKDGTPCGTAIAKRAPGDTGYYVAALDSDIVMVIEEHLYSRLDVRLDDLVDEPDTSP